MNRPYLVNFSAIISQKKLSIRASITNSLTPVNGQVGQIKNNSPIQSISLFSKELFRIKVAGFCNENLLIFEREYDSDNYGRFEIKIPAFFNNSKITKITIYETSQVSGLDFHLGSFLPLEIKEPRNIIISDFDKTLVDTKYHTAKELYYSLSKPLDFFPSVDTSIVMLRSYIDNGYQPFILSASPHFYENAIRNWLYQNNIFASNILLKDYRDFVSIFDGAMTTKDLKKQGFYKLNQLIDVLLMTGIPNNLILMGDGFESDPFIYLTLQRLCKPHSDPWKVWKSIKNHSIFNLTSKQDSYFITKFYQLSEMAKKENHCEFKIHIRSTHENIKNLKDFKFKNNELTELNTSVDYYLNQDSK
jgi:phosphatidate phosphatase APP1